jgi:hypothetical protein
MADSSSSAPADLVDSRGKKIILTDFTKTKSLAKEDIEKLVKRMNRSEINSVVKIAEQIPDDLIGPMEFSIFDFIGFDPFSIIAVIKIVIDHYKEPEEILLSDVRYCIAACLYMGNIQDKALTKRAAEGREKISYLANKYQMSLGSTGSGMSAETVTFPRVAASFPVMAIRMASKISPKATNLEFLSGKVPNYMRLSPFASLCSPKMGKELRQVLMECCNAHGADMAITYEKGRQKKLHKEIRYDAIQLSNDQWGFVEIASSSPVPEEESKISLLSSLNIAKDLDDIIAVSKNYRSIMGKKKIEDVIMPTKQFLEEELAEYLASS